MFRGTRRTSFLRLVTLVALGASGCYVQAPASRLAHEDLDAVLWQRTSAEYRILASQAYELARQAVEEGRKDPTWSAVPGQAERLLAAADEAHTPLPLAVIVDVDETVLDTSQNQVELIEKQADYDPQSWSVWVAKCEATAVPGARVFIQACSEVGVTVFFVTNREVELERYTRQNLEALGLIHPAVVDNILSKNERDNWTVDKTSRRDYVASRYRVLALVGDDLNDFVWAGNKPSPEKRQAAAASFANFWTKKWFLIPNADYGGWERALYNFDDALPREERLKRKLQQLKRQEQPQSSSRSDA